MLRAVLANGAATLDTIPAIGLPIKSLNKPDKDLPKWFSSISLILLGNHPAILGSS